MEYPSAPAYEGGWTPAVSTYALCLRSYNKRLMLPVSSSDYDATEQKEFRSRANLISNAELDRDTEMVLAFGQWMPHVDSLVAVQDTVTVLRMFQLAEVFHMVTADKIDACHRIGQAVRERHGTATQNHLLFAYLAFNDPSLTPKIVMLIEQGVHAYGDLKERLEAMKDAPLSLADGSL